ncbi:hypothetical protein Ddye_002808 [Dipteronia dyeriana]|uniref:DUF4283 domain-containing protein n=1 Tax=Dipteronia dyeriana TaxID=168575 RepID=A0AAD9XR49_9ROSI|nr:hypothetical protein Ddye_002808 [Dipteronia dyeriana]
MERWSREVTPQSKLVWLEVLGVPLSCWSSTFLKKVGSVIGETVMVDESTTQRRRLDKGMVLVLSPLGQKCPEMIEVFEGGDIGKVIDDSSNAKLVSKKGKEIGSDGEDNSRTSDFDKGMWLDRGNGLLDGDCLKKRDGKSGLKINGIDSGLIQTSINKLDGSELVWLRFKLSIPVKWTSNDEVFNVSNMMNVRDFCLAAKGQGMKTRRFKYKMSWIFEKQISKVIDMGTALGFDFNGKGVRMADIFVRAFVKLKGDRSKLAKSWSCVVVLG